MPCFHPLEAYQAALPNKEGKRPIFFHPNGDTRKITLPCGRCIGCRLERSRQWAVRCIHESQMHSKNCFITLTFSPEELAKRPNPWSLDVRDFQLFMKRFRKKYGKNIRFYHCGEYGEACLNCGENRRNCRCGNWVKTLGRPHYHACIFNFDFDDKKLYKSSDGIHLYTSQKLAELWPFGFSTVGDVTFESAAYCARYIVDKINGPMKDNHYCMIDNETGEIYVDRKPEYTTMSRRPGIGSTWLKKYRSDVYPSDEIVVRGAISKPPRYYDEQLKKLSPETLEEIKDNRLTRALEQAHNSTRDRLAIREEYAKARLAKLNRPL